MTKKLFFLSAFPPNSQTAGQNYTKQLIEQLSTDIKLDLVYFDYKGHECTLNNNDQIVSIYKLPNLKIFRYLNVLKMFFFHPLFTSRFSISSLFLIYQKSKTNHLMYFDFSQVFLYALFFPHKNKIMMLHDVISQKEERKKNLLNFLFKVMVIYTEKLVLSIPNSTLLCFSQKDKDLIHQRYNKNAHIVNFVINSQIKEIILNEIEEESFCFFGAWNRKENSEGLEYFINFIIPSLPKNLVYYIIGSGLSNDLKNKINIYPNVKILGFVENPYPIIARCKGLIAPIFQGAGVKVKVIESLACGTHVIGTDMAFEGINFEFPNAMSTCVTPEDFVNMIMLIIGSVSLCDKLNLQKSFLQAYSSTDINILIQSIITNKEIDG